MYLYNAKLVIKDFQSALFIIGFDGVHFSYVCNCVFILFAIFRMRLCAKGKLSFHLYFAGSIWQSFSC